MGELKRKYSQSKFNIPLLRKRELRPIISTSLYYPNVRHQPINMLGGAISGKQPPCTRCSYCGHVATCLRMNCPLASAGYFYHLGIHDIELFSGRKRKYCTQNVQFVRLKKTRAYSRDENFFCFYMKFVIARRAKSTFNAPNSKT